MHPISASNVSWADLAQVFNLAFSDYAAAAVDFSAESLAEWCRANFVSSARSHVFTASPKSSELVGFCLIAVREDKPFRSRIPMFGVVPHFRGNGSGTKALNLVLDAERAVGTKEVELECFQDSAAALALYRRSGFVTIRELPSWERGPVQPGEFDVEGTLEECDIEEAGNIVRKYGRDDLPWQVWGFVARKSPTVRSFKLSHAYCVVSAVGDGEGDAGRLQSLIVEPEWQRQGLGTNIAKAVMGKFPSKGWSVDPVFPQEYTETLARRLGFELSSEGRQYQMRLNL